MKKILIILLLLPLFISCSSDDDNTPTQDYTSFVVENKTSIDMANVVVGYLIDGKYKKLASLGDLKKGAVSKEIRVEDSSIKSVYVFTDYNGTVRADITYNLKNNIKNILILPSGVKGIDASDKTNPEKYPQ